VTVVGIVANPASGKDIRRLIAHGSVFDNQEKVSIVRRVMLGLQAAGVEEVVFMPDYYDIGYRAVQGVQLDLRTSTLDMRMEANQDDSTEAARLMREMGAGAVITLGGDGTNRAVAKEIGGVPMMPISTGTNNVFPQMIEGTIAGLAAGLVASGQLPVEEVTEKKLRLEVIRDDQVVDIALIDVVVYAETFIGSRAVWDMSKVRELMLTQATPGNIGMSSVGAGLFCAELDARRGVYLRMDEGHGPLELTAPVAPGLVSPIHVSAYRLLEIGRQIPVGFAPSVLALDGEREVKVRPNDGTAVRLSDAGPRVIDPRKTMDLASQRGLMVAVNDPPREAKKCLLHSIGLCLDPPDSCLKGMEDEREFQKS